MPSPLPEVTLVNSFRDPFDNAVATARTCYSSNGIVTAEQVAGKGRDPEAALTIPSSLVSRRHASIVVAGERATLRDLGSKNGTLCGERRVTEEVELADGDEIRIGPARLVFCAAGGGSTQSRRSRS